MAGFWEFYFYVKDIRNAVSSVCTLDRSTLDGFGFRVGLVAGPLDPTLSVRNLLPFSRAVGHDGKGPVLRTTSL